jgi:hypothetical protein
MISVFDGYLVVLFVFNETRQLIHLIFCFCWVKGFRCYGFIATRQLFILDCVYGMNFSVFLAAVCGLLFCCKFC